MEFSSQDLEYIGLGIFLLLESNPDGGFSIH